MRDFRGVASHPDRSAGGAACSGFGDGVNSATTADLSAALRDDKRGMLRDDKKAVRKIQA